MHTVPERNFVPAMPSNSYHAPSLADFSNMLLNRCLRTASDDDAPTWQLLYYGVIQETHSNALLAVLVRSGSEEQFWLTADLSTREPWPSLANDWPALLWPEREVWERTGYEPLDHPDLLPILHPHLVDLESRAEGAGVFSLPLGPVRADVSESAFFLFDTVGEQIMHLQPQLFYKHRGIEQLAIGKTAEDVLLLAERISGTSTAAHASACASALEQALRWQPPNHVLWERQLWVELERLYNHAHDLSQLASAAGMTVGQAQLARVKEECLRLAADLTGSRYLRGAVKLFGSSNINWRLSLPHLEASLSAADDRLNHFVRLLSRTPTFIDRLVGTGTVKREWADKYSLVGVTARACGVKTDIRHDFPTHYTGTGYEICTSSMATGDAKSRFDVRVDEWNVSVRMVRSLTRRLANTERNDIPASRNLPREGWGVGFVEGARGRVAHVVVVADGRTKFYGVRSASSWIWPVFGLATANGNIQTDFPVIDASFGLSCAGMDR